MYSMIAYELNAMVEFALGYSGLLYNKAVPYFAWLVGGQPTAETYRRAKDYMLELFLLI